ncbi:MAG: patatin family protein [Clostridia bacterium]|nr:patatin family protein [Clostridia bacterium]
MKEKGWKLRKPGKRKEYSRIDEIKIESAPDTLVEGCLALEGGAFRGVYTSGVLDCLMKEGINLQTTVGVSAGALNGLNYTAGLVGRSAICNLKYRHDSRWVGIQAVRTDRGIVGFEFLFTDFEKQYPFAYDRFFRGDRRFVAVATNLESGKEEYFDNLKPFDDRIFKAVRASASMPFVSKSVEIDGKRYLDGGCATKLPIRWALAGNFSKIVFVATREPSYRREEKEKSGLLDRGFYRRYPNFVEALRNMNRRYNEDCDLIDSLVAEGKIFRIAPSVPVSVSRMEGDMEKLGELYRLGYGDAERLLPALKAYLGLDS